MAGTAQEASGMRKYERLLVCALIALSDLDPDMTAGAAKLIAWWKPIGEPPNLKSSDRLAR